MTDNAKRQSFRSDPEVMEVKFRDALNKIAHDPQFNDVGLSDVYAYIVRTASEVLGCRRSSIWEYRESERSGRNRPVRQEPCSRRETARLILPAGAGRGVSCQRESTPAPAGRSVK